MNLSYKTRKGDIYKPDAETSLIFISPRLHDMIGGVLDSCHPELISGIWVLVSGSKAAHYRTIQDKNVLAVKML